MGPICFNECNTFYKKILQFVDNYCSWSHKKILVINEKNEGVVLKRPIHFVQKIAKILTYPFLITFLLWLQWALHRDFKATILDFNSTDLTPEQKQAMLPFNPMRKLWNEFGYKEEALRDHPSDALFLKNSHLMFIIKAHPEAPLLYDEENQPKILCQGRYQRIGDLRETYQFKLHHNGLGVDITDKEGKEWNFVANHGLVQTDWRFKKEYPSFKLSENQLFQLQQIAKKQDGDPTKIAFLQIYSSIRPFFSDKKLTRNLREQTPTHVGIRLIRQDGTGYSIGYESRLMGRINFKFFPIRFLTTIPAKPSIRDYDEFYSYDTRLVTTIPMDPDKLDSMLDEIESISKESDCRFNHIKMNCVAFAGIALEQAGVSHCFEEYLSNILYKALPDALRPIKINIPIRIKQVLNLVPTKLSTFFLNLLLVLIGMNMKSKEIPDRNANHAPRGWTKLSQFNKGFHWSSLFKKDATRLYWPPLVTAWQREQPSTQIFRYKKGNPEFNIII